MASVALADSNTPTKSLLKGQIADILIRPRVTEKSTLLNEQANVYAFEVRMNATKPMIAGAVKNLYKVTPEKVRIVSLPAKRVFVRGKRGRTAAIKKALVYLKKGDKIELV
ncbi:MAG: 50S ribosomal protein L23 [Patescibacteria group bacterium]|nr:50S ribosomal protein L23 [Patescibacteria group bacterium]